MHSYKLLVIIILIMKKTRSAIYFEKRYCLLVHSLILNQRMTIAGFSHNSCEKEVTDRTCSYNLNQIVYVNCIDVIRDGVTTSDSEALIHFSLTGDKPNKKNGVAVVRFDMNHEKIVKPQSTVLFSKELNEGRGILHYKFINLKTKTLTYEQFELNRQRKGELQLETSKDEQAYKLQQLSRLIEQKDDLVQKLEKKIETLIIQNRKIKDQAHQNREHSKQKTINFNVKVNPFNENLRKENQKLMMRLKQLQEINQQLQNQISEYAKKEETYERQHNLLRKQLQKFEKAHEPQSRAKSKGRTVSYIQQQPSFLRNSNAAIDPYQSNADWVQSQQNPTRITVNEPISRRESYIQPQQQETEVIPKANISKPIENSHNKQLQAKSSMYSSNYVPVLNERGPKESQTSQKQKLNESQNLDNSIDKHGEAALNRRISMQKDDLKWTTIIYERNQQIQILKRKLQQKANELKVAQKEIQKLKVAAKKKDAQMKQMQKQMQKKNIFGNGSSGQLKKNRADLQLQFQKIQAKHDEEKLRLEGQIEQISKQKDMQDKQIKKLKTQLTQFQERSKTVEVKYNQLKRFTQKKEEQFIQYREKSSQYDVMSIKFKELQGALMTTTSKHESLQKESKKEKDTHNALKIRYAQLQTQWQRLRSAERVFQASKNQAILLSKSVESYQHRYNELKKYCIKAQASFNKYKNSKRKNESQQIRQDKEMLQRFIQLAKKMEETQIYYYKQQIQDYNEEKTFITVYFEKMLRQERDKIFDNKDISQDHKKSIIIQKQKEIGRNLQRRLEQIRQKVSRLQKSHDEHVNKMNDSKQSGFNKPLPEQIRILEKRITNIQQKQAQRANQRRNLKETITQVNQELMRVSSSANLQLASQQLAPNKNYSTTNAKGQLMMMSIHNDKNQQRSTVYIDEARQKSEVSHQRLYEQNRKMNTQLVKENGQLKMKNQKLTIDMQKIENKAQSRQRQLEQAFKKSEIDFKLRNDKLTEQLQKKEVEIENLKRQCSDNIQAVANISKEATKLSQELQMKIEEIQQLQQKVIQLQQRIQQYEQGQRIMIQQVNQVKKEAQINQNQLFELIQQRSNNFARIQKIKQTEIDKWKAAVHELQIKLEAQMFENIQAKDKFEALKANYEKLEKETQQKIQSLKIDIESKDEQCNQIYIKEFQTTRQNEALQQNLMEISTQIQNKQLQLVQLTFELTKKTKELEVYKRQCQRFQEIQYHFKDEIKGLQMLLDDKIQQVRGFQDKYKQIQIEIEYNAKDMQKLALSNLKFESQAKQYQQKYIAKHQEIINSKNQCSMATIKMQMQEMTLKNLQNQNEHLKKDIQELNRQIQRLNEATSHQPLRVSRKISNSEADAKFDCPSPGRSRKMPKRTGTLEVPESSMIGMTSTGGITPILPPTPNPLARKMSENPFEPRQESRKSSVQKNLLIQPEKQQDEMIAIHIQSPPTSKLPSKSESNVYIELEQMEESVRLTNTNTGFGSIKRPSHKNEVQSQIREQTQQNQENSGGFGKNIELQDSEYLDDNGEYQEKIRQLERQLIYSNEENQKLNVQIIELTKKVDELSQQVSQLPNRSPSPGVSRRRSILQVPPKQNTERESSDGKMERNPQQSHTLPPEGSIRRSNSGFELNGSHEGGRMTVKGNLGQFQQQYEAAQLQIQYLTNEINGIKAELQQSNKNNERLIEEAQLCRETIEDLNNKLQEAYFQIEQTKNFIQFQELYQQQKETSSHLKVQIEELNGQLFSKQSHISTLMNQNCQAMDQTNEVRAQCASTQESKAKIEQKVRQLTQTIQRLKVQYRKYEQSAQLEIVKLHETIDTFKTKIHDKQDEFVVLGEELINIQNEKQDLATYIEQYGKNQKMKEYHQNQMETRCNQLQAQLDKTDENRQNLYKTIKKLQLELLERDDKQKSSTNQLALTMKKYEIRLQSSQEQIKILQSKIAQKQKIITALKNQIGLYNEQCLQLKNLNDQLNYQSTKVQKQLKDIMVTYSTQIQSYKEIIEFKEKQAHNLNNLIREKQNQHYNLTKNMRMAEKEKEGIQYEYIDAKNALQKLKNAKNKECNDLYMQIQYKNSECQKLKSRIQKNQRDLQSKQQSFQQETQKYESRLKAYKEKLEKYEGLIEQFQIQLKKVEQRPTNEVYEEVIFENQILKNRVDELQQQLHSKGSMKEKEEQVYMEFRKYKANKDRQIQDLNSQMEKYSFKINQLEESMFFLKRQNDALKKQNISLSDLKEEMNIELEDLKQSLQEVEKELQFYKKRKLLDMQKLLNETQ